MYNAWDAHYRTVSVLRFTHDGGALLSASADSGVSVWSVSRSDNVCQLRQMYLQFLLRQQITRRRLAA
jgi:WD40 repeat protein